MGINCAHPNRGSNHVTTPKPHKGRNPPTKTAVVDSHHDGRSCETASHAP